MVEGLMRSSMALAQPAAYDELVDLFADPAVAD